MAWKSGARAGGLGSLLLRERKSEGWLEYFQNVFIYLVFIYLLILVQFKLHVCPLDQVSVRNQDVKSYADPGTK